MNILPPEKTNKKSSTTKNESSSASKPSSTIIILSAIIVLLILSLAIVISDNSGYNTTTSSSSKDQGIIYDSSSKSTSSEKKTNINKNDGVSNTKELMPQQFTLQSAFACKPENCFRFKNGNPIRIAFVGDSFIYGNGSHAGDVAGGKIHQIGVWANEAIASLRKRADKCRGSPFFLFNSSKSQQPHQDNNVFHDEPSQFSFDARNFGKGSTSITCEFNKLSKTPIYHSAVKFRPHVLIIGIGVNDCVPYCKEFTRERFVEQYKAMILKNFSSAKLVVMVAPPPMETSGFTVTYGFRPQVVEEVIVPLTRKVAHKELKVPLLDVFSQWSVELKGGTPSSNNYSNPILMEKNYLIGDGIHPSLKGHQDIARRFDKLVCG